MTLLRNPLRFDETAAREKIDRAIAEKQVAMHKRDCDCPVCAINGAILGGMIANKDRLIEQAREDHRERVRGWMLYAADWTFQVVLTFAACLLAILAARFIV